MAYEGIQAERKTYVVLVSDLLWQGEKLKKGDAIQARATQEVLTQVALGNIALKDSGAAPPQGASHLQPLRRESLTAAPMRAPAPAAPMPAAPMTTEQAPLDEPQQPRRRYTRRDMSSE